MTKTKHVKAVGGGWILHYTDDAGYKAIASQMDWTFKPSQPPGENEYGAYFTTLPPDAPRFSARTRIPYDKQKFVFAFVGLDGLKPKEGGRGDYILWLPSDYVVEEARQRYHGSSEELP